MEIEGKQMRNYLECKAALLGIVDSDEMVGEWIG